MSNLLVMAALSWQVKSVLSLASAGMFFVGTPSPTKAQLKSPRPHSLAHPMVVPHKIGGGYLRSASPGGSKATMCRSCFRDERGRRLKNPSSLISSSRRLTTLCYTQRYFGHRPNPSTRLSYWRSSSLSCIESFNGRAHVRECCIRGTKSSQSARFPPAGHECGGRVRRTSRLASSSSAGGWNSTPGSRRESPEEEDIWSKSTVFEFRSVNDPDTNTSMYRNRLGHESSYSSELTRSAEVEEPDDIPNFMAPDSNDAEWLRFREKERLDRSSPPRSSAKKRGVSRDGRNAKVELSTQLGLPATAAHEELRAEYLVEVKRCHPDMAGDNKFRAKMLERRFQRLTAAWEAYSGERRNPLPEYLSEPHQESATKTRTESDETARDRARARARTEYLKAEAKARAATASTQYTGVMDRGRKYKDTGASSC